MPIVKIMFPLPENDDKKRCLSMLVGKRQLKKTTDNLYKLSAPYVKINFQNK